MDRRLKEVGTLSYISTDAFHTNFWSYAVTQGGAPNFAKTGALTLVSGASGNCPAGTVLRENGKKLYPASYPGVSTYMVGVYFYSGVSKTMFKGFINPNDPMFAPYNSDRPNYQPDSLYTTDNRTKNLGSPVLTLGEVTASGDITTSSNLFVNQNIDASGTLVVRGNATLGGRLILNSGNSGFAQMSDTPDVSGGVFKKLLVSASNCKVGSIVMLTYVGQNNPGSLSAEEMTNGSFKIVSSNNLDKGSVMYLIIN